MTSILKTKKVSSSKNAFPKRGKETISAILAEILPSVKVKQVKKS